jgi:tRNA threonylcarbamoyladenosine biosynthesis protein TsaE
VRTVRIVTINAQETEAVAARLAPRLRAGDVVALRGEMGAGKTTFVRGLARALGFGGRVVSPTYTLAARYPAPVPIDHLDAYFADKERAFLREGGAELLGGEGIAVVEWPERIEDLLPADRLEVELSFAAGDGSEAGEPGDRREIRARGTGARSAALAVAMEDPA